MEDLAMGWLDQCGRNWSKWCIRNMHAD
jgi:hypothetical protein